MTVTAEIKDRIVKCQKILEQDPNSQIFAALAEAFRKDGDLDKAFRVCQQGLKVHPSYGSAHVVMAKINMDRGMYDWAEAEVQKAVELEGTSRATELLLAEIHIYKGEFAAAIRLLKKLSQADPGNDQIRKLLDIAQRIPEEQQLLRKQAEAEEKTIVASAARPVETPAVAAGSNALSIRGLLEEALAIEHVLGALYTNREGLVIEQEWTASIDAATCGATLAGVLNFLSKELMQAQFGEAQAMLIEANGSVFHVVRQHEKMFIFVGDNGTNLGNLRLKVAGLFERFNTTDAGK
jgi:tetratricopeptide (TPR) repeat protein